MRNIIYLLILTFLFSACEQKDEKQKTPQQPTVSIEHQAEETSASALTLRPVEFKELKNWYRDDFIKALPAIKSSCEQILRENNTYMSNSEIQIPTKAYQQACKRLLNSDISTTAELRYFLDKIFAPYLILDKNKADGKFTAYYESSIEVSRTQSDRYPYPIYDRPQDLIEMNLGEFDSRYPNHKIYGRINKDKTKFIPYYTRAEIENMELPASVVLWAKDLVDLNIMQIQGSAIARLENGERVRLSFAGHNGRPFTGIGSILIAEGLIDKNHASMSEIRKWLKLHPDIAKKELSKNERYVFHKIASSPAPVGAHNVPLTAKRSLAVDKQYIPLGAILWLETTTPNKEPFEQLMVAQDVGGAIKGIVRGDIYWGSGDEDVLAEAGRMNTTGQYYILLPKTMEIKNAQAK
ncbi:MAG: MltA domain-containing protein [Alphaproteobacteria bacterium]|nr:MltA domain-containing protein [Alphaproteobacteria bacterium]